MSKVTPLYNKNYNSYNRLRGLGSNSNFNDVLLSNISSKSNNKIVNELNSKYNVNVSIKSVGKDNNSIADEAANCRNSLSDLGSTSVVIAPNILKKMESDPKEKEYVESTIKDYFAEQLSLDKMLSAQGKRATQGAIIFHQDGTWTEAGGIELTPEKLAESKGVNETKKSIGEKSLYYRNSASKDWSNINVSPDSLSGKNSYGNNLYDMKSLMAYQLMSSMLNLSLNNQSYGNDMLKYDMLKSNLLAYSLYNKSNLL